MQGEHYHEWKYNEAVQVYPEGASDFWAVYRFCTQCLKGEEIELKELTQSVSNRD